MFHRVQRLADRLLFFVAMAFLLTGNAAPPASFDATVDRIVGADRFEFVRWEIEALAEKGADASVPLQDYLSDEQRAQFVVDYLARTRQLFAVERDVDRIYSDPKVTNPDAASVDQRAKRDQLRAEVDQRRSTAEAIVEEQISAVLADAGFAVGGRVFPPVQARVTPLPYILIISPRDRIEREEGLDLSAGMTVDRAEAIENGIFSQLNKSALVTPIGGLAAYPAMVQETSDLLGLLQVVAHEWTHHWLFLRPLGYNYLASGDIRTINETVASLVGDEVGILVLKRFYPEIAKRDYAYMYDPPKPAGDSAAPPPAPDPNVFNFNRAMHETRVQVDEYLAKAKDLNEQADVADAAGRVEEAGSLRGQAQEWVTRAETYMEDRRKVFLDNGYRIRKLNQAYFAFHGSYADQPGAAGEDPIGPAVVKLRARIPALREFLDAVSSALTLDDLERVLEQYP